MELRLWNYTDIYELLSQKAVRLNELFVLSNRSFHHEKIIRPISFVSIAALYNQTIVVVRVRDSG